MSRGNSLTGITIERVRTATSAGEVRGFSSSGSLPALGEAIGLPRSSASSVDSHRASWFSRIWESEAVGS